MKPWTPASWKTHTLLQQPEYSDATALSAATDTLRVLPPLVFPGEISRLRQELAEAGRGQRFILQGGDCAERFLDCTQETILAKIRILLQMSVVLTYAVRKPVVKIGRIAGQYSKPRSSSHETINGISVPSYRGDSVNSFDPANRAADPAQLVESYFRSAATLNYIRAALSGGFADLHHPDNWDMAAFRGSESWQRYLRIVEKIEDAIAFMESISGLVSGSVVTTELFTSHEGLLLHYEEALTRTDEERRHYNAGAHMLWIGERTRTPDSAQVEYFRGVSNPVGIKFGPSANTDELVDIIRRLNPANEEGKIVLIHRLGAGRVDAVLPGVIAEVQRAGCNVVWMSDPMHGNTVTEAGMKTRSFNAILDEIRECFRAHAAAGTILAGVHFELTGNEVTECTGGAFNLSSEQLRDNYETWCDPRLNYSQSMEMAFLISELMQR